MTGVSPSAAVHELFDRANVIRALNLRKDKRPRFLADLGRLPIDPGLRADLWAAMARQLPREAIAGDLRELSASAAEIAEDARRAEAWCRALTSVSLLEHRTG